MSYFKAEMHQIRFRLGLCPRPHSRSLQCSPRPLAGFKGPTSKGKEGRGRDGGKERGGGVEGGGREEKGRDRRVGEGENLAPSSR